MFTVEVVDYIGAVCSKLKHTLTNFCLMLVSETIYVVCCGFCGPAFNVSLTL